MSDVIATPAPAPTPATPPLPNSPEARAPDGTLLSNLSATTEGGAQAAAPSTTEPKPASGAPEAYTDFTPPEGYTLSKDLLDSATPIFKEAGLSQAQAQRLVDWYSAQAIAQAKATETAIATQTKEWVDKVHADPDLGPNLDRIKVDISRALDSIGDPVLRKDFAFAMDLTGAGNNPAFIKVFHRLAQRALEGSHIPGGGPSPAGQKAPGSGPRSLAAAMYPNLSQ